VCRPDVRGAIGAGDWIVFFAGVEKAASARGSREYLFVAALCVDKTMRHADPF
jgi:hypothetical protein